MKRGGAGIVLFLLCVAAFALGHRVSGANFPGFWKPAIGLMVDRTEAGDTRRQIETTRAFPPPGRDLARKVRALHSVGGPEALGFPMDIAVQNEQIAILDVRALGGDEQLLLFNRSSGELIARTGPKGQGPTDLNAPQALYFSPTGEPAQLWINDHPNSRVVLYDARDLSQGPLTIFGTDGSSLYQATWVKDRLFGNGNFVTELLRVYEQQDGVLRLASEYGDSLFPGVDPRIASSLNRNSMAVRPSQDKVALAFYWVSRIQIYTDEGELVRSIEGPREVTPTYTVTGRGGFKPDYEKGRNAYLDIDATDDYIFALFGGIDGLPAYGVELHVFTWEGELVEILELGEGLYRFAIDARNGELFGYRWDPDPIAFAFESVF